MSQPSYVITIRNEPGIQLVEKSIEILREAWQSKGANFTFSYAFACSHFDGACGDSNEKTVEQLTKRPEFKKLVDQLTEFPFLELKSLTFSENSGHALKFDSKEPNALVVKLSITGPDRATFVAMLKKASELFNATREPDLLLSMLPESERDRVRAYEVALKSVTDASSRIKDILLKQVAHNTQYLDEQRTRLQKETDDRRAKQDAEYDQKLEALKVEKDQFEQKVRELDTRDKMVVRRKLHEQLDKLVEAQAAQQDVSAEAKKTRGHVHKAALAVLGLSGVALIWTASLLYREPAASWYKFTPFAFSALTFGMTLIFYLRWSADWFSTRAKLEFANKKLRGDVIRASWLAELFLEGKEKGAIEFPEALFRSFSNGLFEPVDWNNSDPHPYGDLAKIVQGCTDLEVGKSGFKMSKPNKP